MQHEIIYYPKVLSDVFKPLDGLVFDGYDDLEDRFQTMMKLLYKSFPVDYTYDDAYEHAFSIGFIVEDGNGHYRIDAKAGEKYAAKVEATEAVMSSTSAKLDAIWE